QLLLERSVLEVGQWRRSGSELYSRRRRRRSLYGQGRHPSLPRGFGDVVLPCFDYPVDVQPILKRPQLPLPNLLGLRKRLPTTVPSSRGRGLAHPSVSCLSTSSLT